MLPRAIELITLDDLRTLVDERTQEGRLFDFKKGFYRIDKNDSDFEKQRVEMLKDISSFANTSGGYLIIGVDEADNYASDVCGFECHSINVLKSKITQIAESGLQPRVPFAMHAVQHSEGRYVLVMRIDQSLIAPHRIIYNRDHEFWARNSNGAYQMDTSDLRRAFTMSATVYEQMSSFRIERSKRMDNKAAIVHLIPQDSFSSRVSFSPELLKQVPLRPIDSSYLNQVINFDGVFTGNTYPPHTSTKMVQQFRNGVIEAINFDVTFEFQGSARFSTHYFSQLIERVPSYIANLQQLGLRPPYWFFLTLANVRGLRLPNISTTPGIEFDRSHMYVPEIEIADLETPLEQQLKPALDMVWNAGGFPNCPFFKPDGTFNHDS